MEDNNNVKYNEDEYVFNDDYNENESGILMIKKCLIKKIKKVKINIVKNLF